MNKPYFRHRHGAPEPLSFQVEREVRFEEVDSLGIVWHGRYPSYFEDARVALGERYGIGYMDFYHQGILMPLKKLHFDYHRPLRFREPFSIEAVMHWSEAARMDMEYRIRNQEGQLVTSGYTVQMMMDRDEKLMLLPPEFYKSFCERWQRGELP